MKRVRSRITAALVFLFAVMLLLFLLTFFGQGTTEQTLPSGELHTAEAKANERTLRTAQVYEIRTTSAPVRVTLQTLAMPVDGTLTSGYGLRDDPLNGTPDFHPAVDLAAPAGAPIRAAADGVVSDTGWDSIYGNYVRVWHGNGLETQYGHCQELLCEPGDAVSAGDTIARVGITGRATGYHVDFQVFADGENVDPSDWLGLS